MMEIKIDYPDVKREIKRLENIGKIFLAALKVGGKTLANDLKDHFAARNQEPNKQGWPKRNFWSGIRRSTALASVSDSEAIVAINHPAINQKVYGGTIRPTSGKNLAIPMNEDAYKAGSPSDLQRNFLRLIVTRSGAYLIEREATRIGRSRSKKGGYRAAGEIGGRFWYHLVPSVTQPKDERALPAETYLSDIVLAAIRGVIDPKMES